MPKQLSTAEFVALMAMIFATIAFSIDAMLPALPEIGQELSPGDINRAQLVLTSFLLGMGVGTLITGPLSDSYGRKPVVLVGSALYILGALLAWQAQTLEVVLFARLVQGLGVAGPRAVGMAIIRDLYSGRSMARIMSFVMLVFTLVPAVAPALGALIIAYSGWRGIFLAFVVFAIGSCGWLMLRQPETLRPENRRPFRAAPLWAAFKEVLRHRVVRISIAVQTLSFACLFAMLTSVQQIYDVIFDRADSFHIWFGFVALVAGTSSLLNAVLVTRFGMRAVITVTLSVQVCISLVIMVLFSMDLPDTFAFGLFVFWQTCVFFQAGLTIGNINALGMEPVGHVAGMASSLISSVATFASALLAIPVGLAFNGTPIPLAIGICLFALTAIALMLRLRRNEPAAGAA